MRHSIITAAATAPWHETPAVAAYIATIDIDHLSLRRPMVVMGSDTLQFTGDPVEQLQDMRRDALDEAFGCTFREASAAGRAHEYSDFEAEQPSADDVLAMLFGTPARFGNEAADRATLMMRGEVRIKDAQKRHGIGMWAGSLAA